MNLIFGMVKDNTFICKNSNSYKYKKNTYKIAYDGNIFNAVIVKQELLSKGYYFETCLEEEIVLKAFIEYGLDVYDKFSGHFVIVIWHEEKSELILMKDYYSIKSLYYKQKSNGNIVFSNDLALLLNSTDNVISYDKFLYSYIDNCNIHEGFITEVIKEIDKVMISTGKDINRVEDINNSECGYIFDEVAQIILSNLENICIVKLEDKSSEISVVSEYILDMLGKEKVIIPKLFSKKRLDWFLTNMALPFFNLAEYNLVFYKLKGMSLIDLELNEMKRFYNVDYYSNRYNINVALPRFCRENLIGVNEVYLSDDKETHCECIEEEFIDKKFEDIKIREFIMGDIDYFRKIYYIRLNNWIDKYNIKIV